MITDETSGVWDVDDVYKKVNAQRWRPNGIGLFSWGSNGSGQLGQNNIAPFSSPVQIPGTTWSSISSGNNHSLATKTDNTLWSWGLNSSGQVGQNTTTQFSSPVQIPGTSWSSISVCYSHSLATQAVS